MTQFGVTKDTKSKNKIPFLPPREVEEGYWFPQGFLSKVKSEKNELRGGGEADVLAFYFVDSTGDREYRHVEWIVEDTDADFEKKMNGLNSRIAHIYKEYKEIGEDGIGSGAKNFKEFFDKVALAFNGDGKEVKPIYKTSDGKAIPVWLKLTYYNGYLKFPLAPNFIERVKANKQPTLTINPKYDKIKNDARPTAATDLPDTGGGGADDFPKGFG